MGLSLQALQKIVASGLLLWFCLLFYFLNHEGPWSSSETSGLGRRYQREFHRMSLADMRKQDGIELWQRQAERKREQRRKPTRNNNNNNNNTLQWLYSELNNTTLEMPRPRKTSRRYQRDKPPSAKFGFFNRPPLPFESLFNSSKSDLKLPLPIILMGFPKAGTSSIFSFFQRQGFRSQHWYCCKAQPSPQKGGPGLFAGCMMNNIRRNQTNLFQGCGDDILEVFSEINGPRRKKIHPLTGKTGYLQDDGSIDYNGPGNRIFLPQHFRIQQIHAAFPYATWILNHRPIESWMKSVLSWGDDLHNQFFNEYFMQGAIPEIPSDNNMTSVRELLQRIYHEHYSMVEDFVQKHPSHALVHVNITDEMAGDVLAAEFGLDPLAWSNVNKNRKGEFEAWRRQRTYRQNFGFEDSNIWWLLVIVTVSYLGWFLGIEVT